MDLSVFQAEASRLSAIAARILGTDADVDDVLQEARLRFVRAIDVDDPPAWLTTVVTRICLDFLRRRNVRPTASDQLSATHGTHDPIEPEAEALLAERVGGAMQMVVEALVPAERAAFVLHDVFGYPYDDISEILGRSGTAVRQLASRARRKLQGLPEPVIHKESREVVEAFLAAARGGDLATLVSLLAPDAVMRADRVGQSMGTEAIYDGAQAVADRFNGTKGAVAVTIDDDLGAAWIAAGTVKVAFMFHVENRLVREIELVADPEVLATIDIQRQRRD